MTAPFRLALATVFVLGGAALGLPAAAQDGGGRRCAVEAPTAVSLERTAAVVQRRQALGGGLRALRAAEGPVVVPVAVHVLTAGGVGATDAQVEAQVDVLNAAFASLGYRFVLAALGRTERAAWGRDLRIGSNEEAAMKRALALDPEAFLNVYVGDLDDDYLGWATTAGDRETGTAQDGVVVLAGTLPGGAEAPFNEGDTGVHEVGHWLGLNHTFAGGCSEPNDGVADTPWQRSASSGCPVGRDSCRPTDERRGGEPLGAAAEGLDPIRNYMDYSDDACMTEFTPGQTERMRALTAEYRPALVAGGRVLAALAPGAFESAFVDVPQTAPLRVVNTTSEPVTVTGARASDPAFAVGGAGTVVPPGGVAELAVTFTAAQAGTVSAVVTVETSRADVAVVVSGAATRPPRARLAPDAARVTALEGDSALVAVTLANGGGAALSFALDAAPPWVAAVDPAAGLVAPGETATLTVTVSTAGLEVPAGQRLLEVTGALALATNDPLRPTVEVPLAAVVSERPDAFALGDPYPNPGRGRITVPLAFPDDAGAVTVEVFDALGRRVAVLAEGAPFAAGFREVVWDASGAAPGLYVVQARAAGGADVGRVVVAR